MPKGFNVLTGEEVECTFFTQYVRPLPKGEDTGRETITVQEHIDIRAQVDEMMVFGTRLAEARKARFDSDLLQEGEDVESLDPGIPRGADPVEIQQAAQALDARVSAAEAKAQAAASEKAKADADAAFKAAVDAEVARRAAEVKP